MQTGKLSAASGRFSRRSSVARGGVKKPGVGYDVESDTVTNDTVDATGGRPVWLLLLTLCLGNAGESVEVMKGGFMLPRATDDAAGMTMISTGIFVGMFIGGFISGAVADTLGRVFAMKWALILACLAGLGQAAAPNIMALVVCRVLSGTGVGAATPPLFALATEYAPPGKSGPAISLVASFWMVGSIFAAWVALIMIGEPEHDWPTWPSDLSGLEGARRLSGGGGGAAAAASYTLPADWVPDPEWDAPWRKYALACASVPIFATVLVICALPPDGTGVDAEDAEPPQSFGGLCSDLMKNHGSSLFLLCVVWFGLNFGSYGLSSWITVLLNAVGVDDAYFVSLLYAFAMLPGNLISIFGIDIIGRKLLLILTMGLSALSAIALGMVDSSNKSMVILAACTFSGASNGGWNALEVLSTESFPTEVRAFSFSILAASGRIASMIAQIVNGALMSSPLKLLSVTATFMTVGCGAALFLKPGAYAH